MNKLIEVFERAILVAGYRDSDVDTTDGTFATTDLNEMINLESAIHETLDIEAKDLIKVKDIGTLIKSKLINYNAADESQVVKNVALNDYTSVSDFVCEVTKVAIESMLVGEKDGHTTKVHLKSLDGTIHPLIVSVTVQPKNRGTLIADISISFGGEELVLNRIILGYKALPIPEDFYQKLFGFSFEDGIIKRLRSEITPPFTVLRDKWVAEYALLLVSQCHYDLDVAIEMGKSVLESCEFAIDSYSPSDAVDDEIEAMRSSI
ncbi:hypothetical protein QTV49_001737 [Vibrio vulnificus]|nr:hypothetical protein [Vibrio vulnificus]